MAGIDGPADLPAVALKPELILSPGAGAILGGTAWFQSVEETKDAKFNLPEFVATLKARGVLAKDNLSSPETGVFQSQTGEILLRAPEKFISVSTPRSEGVSLLAGRTARLAVLRVAGSSVSAAVSACAVDGEVLARSSRIVIVYGTDALNSGTELSEDRSVLLNPGQLPVLMRTGQLELSLAVEAPAGLKLYALGLDGSRRESLPCKSEKDEVRIKLDTAQLKNGPTPFFELARE